MYFRKTILARKRRKDLTGWKLEAGFVVRRLVQQIRKEITRAWTEWEQSDKGSLP